MPPAGMSLPDPKYLHPSIPPWTMELYKEFEQACRSGVLANVAELVNSEPRSPEYLTEGLCAAAFENNVQIVEFLLNKGAPIDRGVPMAAARVKSLPIFQLLLEHGWDINASVIANRTVLPNILDDEQLVRWFLEHGAQIDPAPPSPEFCYGNAFITTSSVCLDIAASTSSTAVFDLLLEHGAIKADSTPLHSAAGTGMDDERIPMMAHLIEAGYDVNATDEVKKNRKIGTPLHYAIRAQSLAKVMFLLERGADPNKPVGWAGSPFKMAESMGADEFVSLLKRYS